MRNLPQFIPIARNTCYVPTCSQAHTYLVYIYMIFEVHIIIYVQNVTSIVSLLHVHLSLCLCPNPRQQKSAAAAAALLQQTARLLPYVRALAREPNHRIFFPSAAFSPTLFQYGLFVVFPSAPLLSRIPVVVILLPAGA